MIKVGIVACRYELPIMRVNSKELSESPFSHLRRQAILDFCA